MPIAIGVGYSRKLNQQSNQISANGHNSSATNLYNNEQMGVTANCIHGHALPIDSVAVHVLCALIIAHVLLIAQPTFATSRTRQPWERVAPCNSHTLDKSRTCNGETRVTSTIVTRKGLHLHCWECHGQKHMVSRVTLATVNKESRREPRGWSEESRDCDRANRGASEMGPACDGQRRVTHWRPKEAQSSDCICVRFDVVIYWISALFYNL